MRKIEKEMVQAVKDLRQWKSANTSVWPIDDTNAAVYLHGNHIADVNTHTGFVMVNVITLMTWPTVTTLSRLRALGVDVCQRKSRIILDGVTL